MTRGRSRHTLALVEGSQKILAEIQPATVRAVCYKLFTRGLIASMAKAETDKISRILVEARVKGEIPWDWIVDETRSAERAATWDDPEDFANIIVSAYRRDYWSQQTIRIEVWSEKGTVRGTLAPVLRKYAVTFRVMRGFGSATTVYDIAQEIAACPVPFVALYVGDWDPSGMYMSAKDLPQRITEYGAVYPLIERLAITEDDVNSGLPEFAAEEKRGDRRYKWFVRNYGHRCIELDALDPRTLRDRVESKIRSRIDFGAWNRCAVVEQAEHRSLIEVMQSWGRGVAGAAPP